MSVCLSFMEITARFKFVLLKVVIHASPIPAQLVEDAKSVEGNVSLNF